MAVVCDGRVIRVAEKCMSFVSSSPRELDTRVSRVRERKRVRARGSSTSLENRSTGDRKGRGPAHTKFVVGAWRPMRRVADKPCDSAEWIV